MKPLKERQKEREHRDKVNAGEVRDEVQLHGADDNGNVIGDDGKPVEGTAPRGFTRTDDTNKPNENIKTDYTKLRSHDALNGENGLAGRTAPDGWDNMSVADKQKWLADNEDVSTTTPAGGWGNNQ